MIKLRLSQFENADSNEQEIPYIEGELLENTVKRAIGETPLGEFEIHEVFQVLYNGFPIAHDYWPYTKVDVTDNILIAPILKGGNAGQTFKMVAILLIAVAASTYLPGSFGLVAGAFSTNLAVAAVTLGGAMLLNALIPPPNPGGIDSVATVDSVASSQMYSFSGQSNKINKFGYVPKVYGEHRMFPLVAANPYVLLEIDPDTNEVVQYLYAIYDFGLGPVRVSDLKIGDSSISLFEDVTTNFVDPNRPSVDEGLWDSDVRNTFSIYKGDTAVNNLGISLNGNQDKGGAVETYQATRTTGTNNDNVGQEIILSFTAPQGLVGYAADGTRAIRSIAMQVEFAVAGSDDWYGFNDLDRVSDFSSIGGLGESAMTPLNVYPYVQVDPFRWMPFTQPGPPPHLPWTKLSTVLAGYRGAGINVPGSPIYRSTWGIQKGSRHYIVQFNNNLHIGDLIRFKNIAVGNVYSLTNFTYAGITWTIIETDPSSYGCPVNIPLFSWDAPTNGQSADAWAPYDASGANKARINPGSGGRFFISRDDTNPVYAEIKFTPRQNEQFDVRVTRLGTTSQYTAQVVDALQWSAINTRYDRAPIVTDKRHTFMELRIRATNQLNGMVQNLNAITTSVLDVWDGTTWTKQTTSNPAWVFVDLLTGQVNLKAISKSRLHLPSILEWAEHCDEIPQSPPDIDFFEMPRFQCNFILDYKATLQTVIGQVASSAQASLNIIDGKYGVLLDKLRTIPIQVFTPRNSRNFNSTRNYGPRPHALRVKYIDPQIDWGVAEVEVYDDGYDVDTAETFEDFSSFGCTSEEQAWRFGRYMLAQNRLRQETISILVDFEHLVCTRGDYVQITQDVMKVGGTGARVKTVIGNQITIDDGLVIDGAEDYGYVLRSSSGEIVSDTLTAIFSDTFELDGELPEVGDLIVIGVVDSIVYDCIVKAIAPNDDLSATITLVEKADGVYEAESSGVLPVYDPQISPTADSLNKPPGAVQNLVVTQNNYACEADFYQSFIEIDWSPPAGAVETYEVYINQGFGYDFAARTRDSVYKHLVDTESIDRVHWFKILAVSATGQKIEIGLAPSVSATPLQKTDPPSSVESLSIDITGEVLQLLWPRVSDCGISEYRIRYSPLTTGGSWEMSIPLMRMDKNATSASTQARTGTYLIKAVDFNGTESTTVALAVTTVPQLFNLNVIEEIDDAPTFTGSKDRTKVSGTALLLQRNVDDDDVDLGFFNEGFYYYNSILDLGDIYTVRLQSLIQAEGFDGGFMSDWLLLSDVSALTSAESTDWDVETQYRSTDEFNVIAEWDALDDVTFLNAGTEEVFTPWRKFVMGDATGRVFQFRLRLLSFEATATPRVFDAKIKADMPDRIDSYNNLLADNTVGYILDYDPAFKGPGTTPNVQISLDDGESGDYWEFDYKSLDGFQVRFFNSSDVQVARQFDVVAKGFGRLSSNVI